MPGRRLSIIQLQTDKPKEAEGTEKDTRGQSGPTASAGGERRRRLSIVGLYTGEVIQAEEAPADVGKRSCPATHT